MQYLEYRAAITEYTQDVLRMRSVLFNAGYQASLNDIERLWDDYSRARLLKGGWVTLPSDDAELLAILLVGFRVNEAPFDDEEFDRWPSHWA